MPRPISSKVKINIDIKSYLGWFLKWKSDKVFIDLKLTCQSILILGSLEFVWQRYGHVINNTVAVNWCKYISVWQCKWSTGEHLVMMASRVKSWRGHTARRCPKNLYLLIRNYFSSWMVTLRAGNSEVAKTITKKWSQRDRL